MVKVLCHSTLLVNAAAILNFKLTKDSSAELFNTPGKELTLGDKVRDFLQALRYFRIFIALWNIFVMFLMIIVFGS
ncbi:hypothetical protein LAZ67_5000470 [Cordylochernes scorpioides]|uniref:Small integral membrane protein 7 n=1 Tax=Cordylochernes scorpioides TaxID=51811 RepID=A0ABY6KFR5_9ARAC|nr:hypothetical protein LAZ67_5000470 [Cordylochernes scorpioides]